ncbi:uncharacterized protein LOC119085308 isoform X2 [Bradysia coprophila]|uniref:uncharacterized protein LOC119085308 isoform X2 n=1 Tax=Bradysia coprophila TaxID=38358 RepID=UPI00187DCE5D|nr:uncharacterized protein LOC119085308 isoform X2 [Bradysia coprophila]
MLSEPPSKLQNGTGSFTLTNEHSIENVDLQSVRQILQNSSSAIIKFDLIQSLVLRLSNQEPDERLITVQDIVDNDVLGASGENGNGNTMEDLLWPVNITTPHPMQTSTAKLLNALVSFEVGRDYFNKISMVKLLTWSGKEQIYDSMADNLIDALKKLSLNELQRRDMLNKGLLQWLINHMEMVEHTASIVHMECMTDLLRVLTNVENTTGFASVNVPHFIVVSVRYLNVANEYVQVNVGQVLRTLFLNDSAVAIGNTINLHRIFRNLLKKASNSKLKADLRFIYELFVKHRADTSTHSELSADNVSRSTVSENAICCGRQDVNSEIDNQTEQLIREQNLMIISERNSNEDATQQGENVELSTEPNRSFTSELRSQIYQLCMDKGIVEMDRKTPNEEINDQYANIESNPGAEVLYSNLNSRLEQSSSLLSSGSQCATSECKESAIQILKIQSVQANSAVEMDHKNQNLLKNSSSKLHLQKVYEDTAPKVLTDYSDLSSIAKDREARNEILENDSFIDELCEKVLKKLTSKLAANFFCGPNCNTNENNNNCCTNVESNVH